MTKLVWDCQNTILQASRIPLLMGILNVTPDSFSDGGEYDSVDAAVNHGRQLAEDGADIIDIGGESTRPGANVIGTDEELRRTIPVIKRLAEQIDVPISIDTTKSVVAEQAIAAGARIVNDISGLRFDDRMLGVCRDTGVGICVMHILGTPQTMQKNPVYRDVVLEVSDYLRRCIDRCIEADIPPDRICVDPGIGFGKTADHNLRLLQSVEILKRSLERPILIGHSRKRFLSKLLGRTVDERLAGTAGVSIGLAQQGADVLRVHDVAAIRDVLIAWQALATPGRPKS
ncbi:MAG: dihydropteroate synthase [Fuerstiella sp.]|nr:dihydropteroate synthase [Fuerstiella sp.]